MIPGFPGVGGGESDVPIKSRPHYVNEVNNDPDVHCIQKTTTA